VPKLPAFPVRPLATTESETWHAGPLLSHVRSKSDAIRECRRAGFRVIGRGGLVELGEDSSGPVWLVAVHP
jgi:hypothetical protein